MRNAVITEDLQAICQASLPWEDLDGKTVLVSGANGFLPAYMVEALLYRNEVKVGAKTKVLALVRNAGKARSRFQHYLDRPDLLFLVQDVCDSVRINGPVDYVIHAASQASPKYYGKDPIGTLAPNIFGTSNLLKLATEKRSKCFLYFSSAEVYGELEPHQVPCKETAFGSLDPTQVRACYAEAKRMGETLCTAWSHQHGLPVRIVRPFHTYGPGMALDDGRVFSDFVADIVHRRDLVMKSDGSAVRAYCYLTDAVAGYFTVLLRGESGLAYNVGNNRAEVSVLELARRLIALFPEKNLRVIQAERPPASGYLASKVSRISPDTTRLEALGWRPEHSLESGFQRTVRSFLNPGIQSLHRVQAA
jgi:nucleoside-diphosphate-sugar epimerase